MDLSGIIFVVLAVGWAGYLIPKALKHHDDLAMNRPVDTFSDSVRVVGASAAKPVRPAVEHAATPAPAAEHAVIPVPTVAPEVETPRRHAISHDAARRAAQRRRRVLAVLLLAFVAVGVASYLGATPWWSTAVPAVLVVAFLGVARLTVRAQQVRRAAPDQPAETVVAATAPVGHVPARTSSTEVEPDLGREDTQGLSRDELAAAVAVPVLDDGGLWDPLPVTLPTYVNKARARRTVRTIEITGMTSSGHDAADTELARTAEETAKAEAGSEAGAEAEQRRAAGA